MVVHSTGTCPNPTSAIGTKRSFGISRGIQNLALAYAGADIPFGDSGSTNLNHTGFSIPDAALN
jgi:hypothetical protein